MPRSAVPSPDRLKVGGLPRYRVQLLQTPQVTWLHTNFLYQPHMDTHIYPDVVTAWGLKNRATGDIFYAVYLDSGRCHYLDQSRSSLNK